jgi:hypothetical protein
VVEGWATVRHDDLRLVLVWKANVDDARDLTNRLLHKLWPLPSPARWQQLHVKLASGKHRQPPDFISAVRVLLKRCLSPFKIPRITSTVLACPTFLSLSG